MTDVESIASFTITVFTRHSAECPKAENPQWKRCNCRKSLYIREDGKTRYVTAKTRSWEEAERYAQAERDKRDPVKIELQKIAETKAAKLKPIGDALDQWLAGMKSPGESSIEAYRSTTRKIQRWAERQGVRFVRDATPSMLDKWRGAWDTPSEQIARTTQAALLTRIKAFFRWATAMEYTPRNPALMLKAITPNESQTWPLTPKQFEELLAATRKLDADARYKSAQVGEHLRALFQVQRTGLRVGDVLALPKSGAPGQSADGHNPKKRNRNPLAARWSASSRTTLSRRSIPCPFAKKSIPSFSFGPVAAHSLSTQTSGSAKLTGSTIIWTSRMRSDGPCVFDLTCSGTLLPLRCYWPVSRLRK